MYLKTAFPSCILLLQMRSSAYLFISLSRTRGYFFFAPDPSLLYVVLPDLPSVPGVSGAVSEKRNEENTRGRL